MPMIVDKKPPLKAAAKKVRSRPLPLWQGPGGDGPQGGVSFSLLSRYLSCKERFRLMTVEGLKPQDRFDPRLEFGNIWHAMEEALASDGDPTMQHEGYVQFLRNKYPMQRADVNHWADKCRTMFPIYVDHWRKHPDVVDRKPLGQEQVFDVPYQLPSGRTARLRGKFDSVDLIGKGRAAAVWLQENKTKSDIDELKIGRQLTFDLQTMLYLIALLQRRAQDGQDRGTPVAGVRYNVVRRSAHKQGKKETPEAFCERLAQLIRDDIAEKGVNNEWFQRWNVEVTAGDVARFRRECLDPVLENLLDDYEWWAVCKRLAISPFDFGRRPAQHLSRHHRQPYLGYNPLEGGGSGELDEFMTTGSMVGLRRADDLFPELRGAA